MPIQKNLDGQENILYWARRKNYLGRNLALFEPKLSYSSTVATKESTELSDYQKNKLNAIRFAFFQQIRR